jgi:starvation-inducible DNA-binding protein
MSKSLSSVMGISDIDSLKITDQLDTLLSDYQVFFHKLQNFHWNIRGKQFYTLHEKFEEMYNRSIGAMDDVAERIRFYGRLPTSRMSAWLKKSGLPECESMTTDGFIMYTLQRDLEHMIRSMKEIVETANHIGDEVTADMLINQLSDLQNDHWQVSAWLADSDHTLEKHEKETMDAVAQRN